jgi:hypothetical protein
MTKLIAFLSTGKGTWGHVSRLLNGMASEKWEKVFLLTNEFGSQNFKPQEGVELIQINNKVSIKEISKEIQAKLKEREVNDMEVAVNFISGDGKEHMALLSALMKMGVGFRLVALDKESNVVEV